MDKVEEALELFKQCDETYQRIVLHATGFNGRLCLEEVKIHFQNINEFDGLDATINDMRDDIADKIIDS